MTLFRKSVTAYVFLAAQTLIALKMHTNEQAWQKGDL